MARNERVAKAAGLMAAAVLLAAAGTAEAATATRARFGTMKDGTVVDAVTLAGANGVKARIVALGATLQALEAPGRDGRVADVTLGYDDLASYVDHPNY